MPGTPRHEQPARQRTNGTGPEVVPARATLEKAVAANRRLGHENVGFLSETHGFVPVQPPRTSLPSEFRAWDEAAERLPWLYRTLQLRRTLDALPVLSADEERLPDRYLLRAASLLAVLAHAYHRVEPAAAATPACIQQPWETVSRRLGRPAPVLSYIDLIVYNWRLVDPAAPETMRVENLRLLHPTVGNREEEIFYLTQLEILARCAPITGAVVRAQEAVAREDVGALQDELIRITEVLQQVTFNSLLKIDPNPHSHFHVDPVVWAKTVAPFAVPLQEGVQGPSGTSSPIFNLLDAFFGRRSHATMLGREILGLRSVYPPHWRAFLDAVAQVRVGEFVERVGDRALGGIYREALQAYAGDTGFLGRHRLKVYGYLELAFKVGRSVTIGGFKGLFHDRTWDEVDAELEASRAERQAGSAEAWHQVRVKRMDTTHVEGTHWVKQVVLDVAGTGIRYRPGDRVGILPENSDRLVERTLRALRATGDEPVLLSRAWREMVALRPGYAGAREAPLRTLLRFGRIRPVSRAVARVLHAVTDNADLGRILEAHAEERWELWELLERLGAAGWDPRSLWQAQNPAERESICWIVPPETFRMYSVSSAPEDSGADGASELHLTVGRLRYRTKRSEVSPAGERLGTASDFLGRARGGEPERATRLTVKLVRPARFQLPRDPSTPIVMIAGGTGLSPFRGFLLERERRTEAGENWFFFATRTRDDFFYEEELYRLAGQGRLHLRAAFTREDMAVRADPEVAGGRFVMEPGRRWRIDEEMLREENARVLWDLLRGSEEGGRGAHFYICGRTGFANTVLRALHEILHRYTEGEGEERSVAARQRLYRLVAEGRLMQEIFTTYSAPEPGGGPTFDASEVALHNDESNGYWLVIRRRVYDVTEFAQMHPGGFKVLRGYAGMDATRAYQKVRHHASPEVEAMLGMYGIGTVRRLRFGSEWGVVLGRSGLRFLPLDEAFRAWVRLLYLVVEMENALANDWSIRAGATTRDESSSQMSPYKLQFLLDVHRRFLTIYLAGLAAEPLEELWMLTSGLCAPTADVRWMRQRLDGVLETEAAHALNHLGIVLEDELRELVRNGAAPESLSLQRLAERCRRLEAEDRRFLRQMKLAVREGVRVFEELEQEAVRKGAERLLEIVQAIPGIFESYYVRSLGAAARGGWLDVPEAGPATRQAAPPTSAPRA